MVWKAIRTELTRGDVKGLGHCMSEKVEGMWGGGGLVGESGAVPGGLRSRRCLDRGQ